MPKVMQHEERISFWHAVVNRDTRNAQIKAPCRQIQPGYYCQRQMRADGGQRAADDGAQNDGCYRRSFHPGVCFDKHMVWQKLGQDAVFGGGVSSCATPYACKSK